MNTKLNETRRILSVFDFDGTLTYRDSFIPFLRFAFGKRVFARRMMHLVLPSARCVQRKLTRDELKERLIATFLSGADVTWIQEKAEAFCRRKWDTLMRKSGLQGVAAELYSGAEVTLCSASPEIVLRPFAERLGVKLIGTQLEVENGKLTGKINGHNCRCHYKVQRLESVYGSLNQYYVRAWGDTRGDYELLASANDAHWRHFHPSWLRRKPLSQRLLLSGVTKIHP
ncbi:HAD family hydrolase [Pectobacterium fontis]|uniref:HAD family hydrolase n=1 Tax=Pectobacterium fontis TaxID=2558042 RepID=A0A7V8L3L8_9GAMM|nr:HAD family hydrolase [Pectobacterium fontis]KHN49728.1 HAD family hydrolase [Pectobacterium fontis]